MGWDGGGLWFVLSRIRVLLVIIIIIVIVIVIVRDGNTMEDFDSVL